MVDDDLLALVGETVLDQAAPLLFVNLKTKTVRAVELQGSVVVSALKVELTPDNIAAIERRQSSPMEYRILAFPSTVAPTTAVRVLDDGAWQTAMKQL
jgi:hypothetical protein